MRDHQQPNQVPSFFRSGYWLWLVCPVALLIATNYWIDQLPISLLEGPPIQVDEIIADNVACQLVRNHEFAINFSDVEWATTYSNYNTHGQFNWIFSSSVDRKTTAVSPGFPYLLSLSYRAFRRDWEAIRSFNRFALVIALTVLIFQMALRFGQLAAIVLTVTLCLDAPLLQSTFSVNSAAISAAIMTLFFCATIHAYHSPVEQIRLSWRWPLVGSLFGILMLLHWQANYWILAILAIGIVIVVVGMTRKSTRPVAIRQFQRLILFAAGALLIGAPWWVRNCRVTNEFNPLGNEVAINLVGGYCDDAALQSGNRSFVQILKLEEELTAENLRSQQRVEWEQQLAERSKTKASRWIEDNPSRVPLLMLEKIASHLQIFAAKFGVGTFANQLLYLGALAGTVLAWRRMGWVVASVFILSVITVALTWAENGRYFVPVRPLMHAALATVIGIVVLRLR